MEEKPKSDVSGMVCGIDLEGKKDCSISELISFLKSAFRCDDFARAEQMLRSQEEKLKGSVSDLGIKCSDLEKELGSSRIQCAELMERNKKKEEEFSALAMEFEKKEREGRERVILLETRLGEMEFGKLALEEDLEKYKRMCSKIEEQIANLEEDHMVICGREQRARERIVSLEEEMKKKEQEAREKFVELKVESRDLECGKRRAENDITDYKKQCAVLEARVLQLEEENSSMCRQLLHGGMKVEPKELMGDACFEEKEKNGFCTTVEHQDEVVHASADLGSACRSSVIQNVPQVSVATRTEKDHVRKVRQKLSFNEEGNSDKKENPVIATSAKSREGVVVIIDSDDEMDIAAPTINLKAGNSRSQESYCNLKGPDSQKSLRMDFDLKATVEDDTSSCEENITPSFSTPKRKRVSQVIKSDNEEEEDEDDDKVPIAKLRMKKISEVTDRCFGSPTSSGDDNVEKSITPSRRRIIPLRQCEEKKSAAEKSCVSHCTGERLSPPFGTNGASYQSPRRTSPESHPEEDEVEEVESDSEGESLGGFIVQGSNGSESEGSSTEGSGDEAENHLELNLLLENIRRKKRTSKWEYEADMLSSFSRDPELCMKAVCALYRQQTSDEKSMKGSLYSNKRGFSKFDALKGSDLAEFLTDGDPHGPLKKSVAELERYDPKALEDCSRLASRYSKQLFEIYQNKEDPHFLPC